MLTDEQFVCTIVDITTRKQAEEALIIRDHAISSSINAIAIMDLDFAITYVNHSLVAMMNYPDPQEFSHKYLWDYVVSKEGVEVIKDALQRNHSTGSGRSFSIRRTRRRFISSSGSTS